MSTNTSAHDDETLPVTVKPINVKKIVMVVGTTGTGKSTIINMLYNNNSTRDECQIPCPVGNTVDSVTKEPVWLISQDGKVYGDTIGFSDPSVKDEDIASGLKKFIKRFDLGVHCIIIVAKFGRFSKQERCNLEVIGKIFGDRWVDSCIMVLTHYEGDTNEEAQRADIEQWLGSDLEMKNFVSKIGKRIVLTNNSVARLYEAVCKPLREQCLRKLNTFVNMRDSLITSAPVDILEVIKYYLEQLFDFYRTRNAQSRIQNILKYVQDENVQTGVCSICRLPIVLTKMARTECHHSFHMDCITKDLRKKGGPCPICGQAINEVCFVTTIK